MKALILEDEATATRKLIELLGSVDPHIEIVGTCESVEAAATWIAGNAPPDVGFFDIQLSDATSFEVFERCEVRFPVVFVTAYDNYLLKAFDHNSIHYLLKPVTADKVTQALTKLRNLERHFMTTAVRNFLSQEAQPYQSRLIVRKGLDHAPIDVNDIAYCFTEHKLSFVRHRDGSIFMIDAPLSDLEKRLDPKQFFRANRQYLVRLGAIRRFRSVDQSKISLELTPAPDTEVVIGKEAAVRFRKWIGGAGA